MSDIKFTREEIAHHAEFHKWKIGDYTYGHPIVLSWNEGPILEIGKYCSIAERVTILLGGAHRTDWVTTYPLPPVFKPIGLNIAALPPGKDVVIGNDVWLASSCVIMPGVRIGDGACVGAFSVVTKDVPPYAIVAGNPARVIRRRFTDEQIASLLRIKWWNWPDSEVSAKISSLCSADVDKFLLAHDDLYRCVGATSRPRTLLSRMFRRYS